MSKFKVCMLGAFAVGKTSLVQRYVHSIFSEKYQTTQLRRGERWVDVVETSKGYVDALVMYKALI